MAASVAVIWQASRPWAGGVVAEDEGKGIGGEDLLLPGINSVI